MKHGFQVKGQHGMLLVVVEEDDFSLFADDWCGLLLPSPIASPVGNGRF